MAVNPWALRFSLHPVCQIFPMKIGSGREQILYNLRLSSDIRRAVPTDPRIHGDFVAELATKERVNRNAEFTTWKRRKMSACPEEASIVLRGG